MRTDGAKYERRIARTRKSCILRVGDLAGAEKTNEGVGNNITTENNSVVASYGNFY